jgi:hypothetical protein
VSDWPQTGDSIRTSSGNERFHAQLDLGNWGIYPKAYIDAANLLVGTIVSGSNPDLIGYPLMYLYRHYLELMIKRLIELGRALDSNRDPCGYPGRHELNVLWRDARPLIEKYAYRLGESRADLDSVGAVVEEFARIDPTGEVFRYSETRFNKGKGTREKTLPAPLHLSLDQVAGVMKRLDGFFVGVESVMDELLQFQPDVNSESF